MKELTSDHLMHSTMTTRHTSAMTETLHTRLGLTATMVTDATKDIGTVTALMQLDLQQREFTMQ